jgi:hypothetical protein
VRSGWDANRLAVRNGWVTYSFPGHPGGAAGIALLLLRLATAVMMAGAALYAIQRSLNHLLVFAAGLTSLLLLLGLGTRIVAFACAAVAIGVGVSLRDWRGAIVALEALNLVSMGLLGAGAYSIDAYLFGRRVIRLDDDSHP